MPIIIRHDKTKMKLRIIVPLKMMVFKLLVDGSEGF
jgi:hypothetical protein